MAAYHEKHKTHKLALIVDQKSADPGVNASMPIPIDADHLSICKPADRNSVVYLSIRRRLRDILPNPKALLSEELAPFELDDLESQSTADRRDLLAKMAAAGREHEYGFANDSQSRFARAFVQNGLKTSSSTLYRHLLADIEQRFQSLVFHPLICNGADNGVVQASVQNNVVDPLTDKYADRNATSKTIMNELYFLTERGHIRWDKP